MDFELRSMINVCLCTREAVGINPGSYVDELNQMASPGAVLSVPNFNALVSYVEPLMRTTCEQLPVGKLHRQTYK